MKIQTTQGGSNKVKPNFDLNLAKTVRQAKPRESIADVNETSAARDPTKINLPEIPGVSTEDSGTLSTGRTQGENGYGTKSVHGNVDRTGRNVRRTRGTRPKQLLTMAHLYCPLHNNQSQPGGPTSSSDGRQMGKDHPVVNLTNVSRNELGKPAEVKTTGKLRCQPLSQSQLINKEQNVHLDSKNKCNRPRHTWQVSERPNLPMQSSIKPSRHQSKNNCQTSKKTNQVTFKDDKTVWNGKHPWNTGNQGTEQSLRKHHQANLNKTSVGSQVEESHQKKRSHSIDSDNLSTLRPLMVDEMDIVTFKSRTNRTNDRNNQREETFNKSCAQNKSDKRHSSEQSSHQTENMEPTVKSEWIFVNRKKQKHKYKLKARIPLYK